MNEPESRKYARKLGCVLAPIWMPLHFISAMLGLIFGVLRRGFTEGNGRADEIANAFHMWDQER